MSHLITLSIFAALGVLFCATAAGAEIQLRRECRATTGLVTLGDVAEVRAVDAAEADRLAAIELCPAPAAGKKRSIGAAEIRQLLARSGVNLAQCRLSGASEVLLSTVGEAPAEIARRPVQDIGARRRVEQSLRTALASYLQEHGAGGEGLEMRLEFPADAPFTALAEVTQWQLSGGREPWTGLHEFVAEGSGTEGALRLEFRAEIAIPASVVVAAAPIVRGAIIQESDLRLAPLAAVEAGEKYFYRVQDVAGQEAVQTVAEGRALPQRAVRQPLLVKRGEIVTVLARSGGVSVETNGRAKSDGSLGEVIAVESLANKQSYFARVSAVQRVEIYAKATRLAAPQAAVALPRPQPQEVAPTAPVEEPAVARRTPPLTQANDQTGGGRGGRPQPHAAAAPAAPEQAAPPAATEQPAPKQDSTLRWVKRRAR